MVSMANIMAMASVMAMVMVMVMAMGRHTMVVREKGQKNRRM
jgi:hypothetical protein